MAKTKAQKIQVVEKTAEKIKKAKILVFTSFSQRGKKGLNFAAMEKLKKELKRVDAEYMVLKKTLLDLALQRFSFEGEIKPKDLGGSVAVLFGYNDLIEPVKILHKLSKENEALVFYLALNTENNEIISKELLVELANLPSREILLYRLAGAVRYPLSGMVNVLQGSIRGLVNVLGQIKK